MPGPFEKPAPPSQDRLTDALEKGARARQILALGVGEDLQRRRAAIWAQAEMELRGGTLTLEQSFTHVACSNALRRYAEELTEDIKAAQRAADALHAESEPVDGDQ